AIEACGISTLSQSPMLGFHKQMDNRIKLLEEILSFRMQGVEFDNGDMYVDGHKAASDVRDEFVSVTEKVESIARPRRNGERRRAPTASISKESPAITGVVEMVIRRPIRSEERFSRNAETDVVCRLLLEKKERRPTSSRGTSRK